MSAHRILQDLFAAGGIGEYVIDDPGDAGRFIVTKNFGVALLAVGAGSETRTLPTPTGINGIGIGTRLLVCVDTSGGGAVTITDGGSNSFILDSTGIVADFTVVQLSGIKTWIGSQYFEGVTSTAAELNLLDGVGATTEELNAASDASTRILITTATTVAVGTTTHAGRILLLAGRTNATYTYTLPAATGSGNIYTLKIGGTANSVTQGTHIITVTGNDTIQGLIRGFHSTTTGGGVAFIPTAGTTITLDHATHGGQGGDTFEFIDSAADLFTLSGFTVGTGTLATPVS